MIVLHMEYVAPAAITANLHVIVIYIPLGWLFFLKGMTLPFTHVSAKPSSLYKKVEYI
jgi:hypothetical protein